MQLQLDDALAILERTPNTLEAMLTGLADDWIRTDEGPDTWSAFDVVGHLIHGEVTDWMARLERIRTDGPDVPFEPFDRFAQYEASRGRSLADLLAEFARLRAANLDRLRGLGLTPNDFALPGMHPELGPVTLGQLLATWVVHDLGHIAQISRVLAKCYAGEVGPWGEYLPVLSDREPLTP